jgi:hypothetical protein
MSVRRTHLRTILFFSVFLLAGNSTVDQYSHPSCGGASLTRYTSFLIKGLLFSFFVSCVSCLLVESLHKSYDHSRFSEKKKNRRQQTSLKTKQTTTIIKETHLH